MRDDTLRDFCSTPAYRRLLAKAPLDAKSARELGVSLAKLGESYHAYSWFLAAASLGDHDAADRLEELEIAEEITSEDRFLAHLQISIWFHRGIWLAPAPEKAYDLLAEAAMPFLELPSIEELQSAPDVEVARDAAWERALSQFGISKDRTEVTGSRVEEIIQRLLAETGWPATLDFSLPLGPATPNTPWWLHPRHAVAVSD